MAPLTQNYANNYANDDATELLQGQTEVLNHLFGFVDSLAVRSAIELGIPDIIQSYGQGQPMTLSKIASKIKPTPADVPCLARVMRVLVQKKFLSIIYKNEEPYYGPTPASKWLLRDSELSLAPTFLSFTDPSMMFPWHQMGRSIKEGGGTPFEKAHGESFWEKASREPEFNELFNTGMAALTRATMKAIITGYSDGFSKLEGTLVDTGGGIGKAVSEIVKAHPHIKGINFDLPHVVATAPQYDGVTHVGGDLFKEIPKADTIFLKSVLHDWGDEDCVKILKNCQKAVSNKGKVIIVDIVLQSEGNEHLDDSKLACDLLMMALCVGGKERTENEWKKLLKEAGFARYNIISIPSLVSIIEAFPN